MDQQTIVCSNCKTPNPARNLYCQSCGRPLIAASPYPSYPAQSDATQPVPGQPTVPVPPPYAPPPPAVYTPPPAPPQADYTPPPPPDTNPPAPEQPPYAPPPQPPTYTPDPNLPQYPPPPAGSSPAAYPQQPGVPPTYAAPAPYPPQPAQPDFFQKTQARAGSFIDSMKKETYSVHADGWSDLIAGEGEKAAEIEQGFVDELTARGLTNVDLERVEVVSGLHGRAYQVAKHQAGSVSVYASAAGKDLMLGWDLNVAQKISWRRIAILALAAVVVSFLVALFSGVSFLYFIGQWIANAIGWCFNLAILGLIAGQILKGDFWYMFIQKPEPAALQELSALAIGVHQCLAAAVKKAGMDETALRRKDKFKMG